MTSENEFDSKQIKYGFSLPKLTRKVTSKFDFKTKLPPITENAPATAAPLKAKKDWHSMNTLKLNNTGLRVKTLVRENFRPLSLQN